MAMKRNTKGARKAREFLEEMIKLMGTLGYSQKTIDDAIGWISGTEDAK